MPLSWLPSSWNSVHILRTGPIHRTGIKCDVRKMDLLREKRGGSQVHTVLGVLLQHVLHHFIVSQLHPISPCLGLFGSRIDQRWRDILNLERLGFISWSALAFLMSKTSMLPGFPQILSEAHCKGESELLTGSPRRPREVRCVLKGHPTYPPVGNYKYS